MYMNSRKEVRVINNKKILLPYSIDGVMGSDDTTDIRRELRVEFNVASVSNKDGVVLGGIRFRAKIHF